MIERPMNFTLKETTEKVVRITGDKFFLYEDGESFLLEDGTEFEFE